MMMLGGGADERHEAAQNGREGQGHQREPRRPAGFAGGLQVDRHEKGEGGDVVHEGRKHRAGAAEDRDVTAEAAAAVDEAFG